MPEEQPSSPASSGLLEGDETPWFIFTAYQRGYCLTAPNASKAIASWHKQNRVTEAGEIVAVIRGAGGSEQLGKIVKTPIYGVIVCICPRSDTQEKSA